MRSLFALASLSVVLLAFSGCVDGPGPLDVAALFPGPDELRFELVASGLEQPVGTAFAPDMENLFWVIEKGGLVQIVWDGIIFDDPALDLRGHVETGNWEQGLLAMVFHPEENRVFFLMTPVSMEYESRVEDLWEEDWPHRVALMEFPYEYQVNGWINMSRGAVLFEVEQPRAQHNGGDLIFGPDGHLYVGIGEGGFGELAQRRDNLLGSILRLDVSEPGTYSVPPDNPFVGDEEVMPEVWQHGLRNPWRMGLDPATESLWVADVGGSIREEINRIPLAEPGGNWGWNHIEGDVVRVDREVDQSLYRDPVFVYETHAEDPDGRFRCAIIGGMVYRGELIPGLQGSFVYSDLCSGAVYALKEDGEGGYEERVLLEEHRGVVAIEEDWDGEILVVNHDKGTIRRIVPAW